MTLFLLRSVPNKHIPFYPEMICRPGHPCSDGVMLCSDAFYLLIKKLQLVQFGYCTLPHCDFENSSALPCMEHECLLPLLSNDPH